MLWTQMILLKKNCSVYFQHDNFMNNNMKHQLDMLAYTYPYHMCDSTLMKPLDCQFVDRSVKEHITLENSIK